MPKSSPTLDWCVVRLGNDHNWWVEEVSDPVRWDVDGLSLIDPRQLAHVIELIEPLRDYDFEQDVMERAFIPFGIDKDLGGARVRLVRVKESFFESEEKLFALPDIADEESGPYADFLDHITHLRVKMLNSLFDFEQKLTVDEVEDAIREEQNNAFIEGKAVHIFEEITAILDFVPEGWEIEDEDGAGKAVSEEDKTDLPDIEEDLEEEAKLKNDTSLKWDADDEPEDDEPGGGKIEGAGEKEDGEGKKTGGKDEAEPEKDDDRQHRKRGSRSKPRSA